MRLALAEAERALGHDDVPIGAVVARDGAVLAVAGNERTLRQDPTAHAEVLSLREAAGKERSWRLTGSTLYVTLEPCPMCAGAVVLARMDRLVYGPQDPRAGAAYSLYNIVQDPRLNHSVEMTTGILEEEASALLRSFFENKRTGWETCVSGRNGTIGNRVIREGPRVQIPASPLGRARWGARGPLYRKPSICRAEYSSAAAAGPGSPRQAASMVGSRATRSREP